MKTVNKEYHGSLRRKTGFSPGVFLLGVGKLTQAKASILYEKYFQRTRDSYSEFWWPVLSQERGFQGSGKGELTFPRLH